MLVFLTFLEVEMESIKIWDQSRQRARLPFQQYKAVHGGMCLSSQLLRKWIYKDHSPGCPDVNKRPYLNNNYTRKVWCIAQVMECLSSKLKAWSSNPSNPSLHQININDECLVTILVSHSIEDELRCVSLFYLNLI